MRPTDPSVSSAALSLLLDTLETAVPTTRKALAASTGLGLSTVTRAVSACVTHGVLRYETSISPDSGRPCRTICPAEGLLLPLLTLTRSHGSVRILDMNLDPVGSTATELHPEAPPEEGARILSRRLLSLLGSLEDRSRVAAPVLLTDRELSASLSADTITSALGTAPLAILSWEEAIAHTLNRASLPRSTDSLLFLSVGEVEHACLLLRDGKGRWTPSALGEGLTSTLTRSLRTSPPSVDGVRRGTAVFLTDLCRFLRPRLVYVEDPRGLLGDGGFLTSLLPEGMEVLISPAEGKLTMAQRGAALAGRRLLWDRILQG